MLIEFRVKNYRSFRDEQVLSLVAGTRKDLPENRCELKDIALLRSAVLYGANASGKSNLVRAMGFMRLFVTSSASERQAGDEIDVTPFLLDADSKDNPTKFEIAFLDGETRYQYGFTLTRLRVLDEWLIADPGTSRRRCWFDRRFDSKTGETTWTFPSGNLKGRKAVLKEATRDNALFLSVGAQLNNEQLTSVFGWFRDKLRVVDTSESIPGISMSGVTASRALKDADFKRRAAMMLQSADFGIEGFDVSEEIVTEQDLTPSDIMSEEMRKKILSREVKLLNVHMLHHAQDGLAPVAIPYADESNGTKQFFELEGPLAETLENGYVLVIDELTAHMHPLLTRRLIEMIHDPDQNRNGAQLVFATHDTTLLDLSLFRRDQIWFTEKDRQGASHLYSLHDYKGVRKGEALQKGYLAGRYGALPMVEKLI